MTTDHPARPESVAPSAILDVGSLPFEEGYRELVSGSGLSIGLFDADLGYADAQEPHDQDEMYVVVQGHADLEVDGAVARLRPGAAAYVPAGTPHLFVEVHSQVRVLVVFGGRRTGNR